MAVPKHKASKQQTNSRFANWKVATPAVSECPQCHEMKLNHRVCKNCGYYDGVKKIDIKQDKE